MMKRMSLMSNYEGLLDSVRKVNNFPKPANEKQVVYKLRHKPSGLFALSADSKYTEYSLTKLSATGKVYTRNPKLPDNDFRVVYPCTFDDRLLNDNTCPNEWELISYTLTEIKE